MLRSLNQFKQIVQIEMNCVQINECRFLSVQIETVCVCVDFGAMHAFQSNESFAVLCFKIDRSTAFETRRQKYERIHIMPNTGRYNSNAMMLLSEKINRRTITTTSYLFINNQCVLQ